MSVEALRAPGVQQSTGVVKDVQKSAQAGIGEWSSPLALRCHDSCRNISPQECLIHNARPVVGTPRLPWVACWAVVKQADHWQLYLTFIKSCSVSRAVPGQTPEHGEALDSVTS